MHQGVEGQRHQDARLDQDQSRLLWLGLETTGITKRQIPRNDAGQGEGWQGGNDGERETIEQEKQRQAVQARLRTRLDHSAKVWWGCERWCGDRLLHVLQSHDWVMHITLPPPLLHPVHAKPPQLSKQLSDLPGARTRLLQDAIQPPQCRLRLLESNQVKIPSGVRGASLGPHALKPGQELTIQIWYWNWTLLQWVREPKQRLWLWIKSAFQRVDSFH